MLCFMSIGVVVTKIMTFFQNCKHVGLDFCRGVLAGPVGNRPIPVGWLAGCMLGRYDDVARVSLSNWPLCV